MNCFDPVMGQDETALCVNECTAMVVSALPQQYTVDSFGWGWQRVGCMYDRMLTDFLQIAPAWQLAKESALLISL
jgi:hypothetical protein